MTATNNEALNEYAHNAGMDNPEAAWILHDRDIWLKNPYYSGPPVPHPEDDYAHMEPTNEEREALQVTMEPEELPADDDCPF
jgi:hypothetical protein